MSKLHDYLAGYLELRHALGYKLRTHRSSLKNFVQFAYEKEATTITTQLALAWAMKPDDANPKWWAYNLNFAKEYIHYPTTSSNEGERIVIMGVLSISTSAIFLTISPL